MLDDIAEFQKVAAANSILAAIVQSSDDVIVSKTLQGIVTSWNPAAEKLFGYRADEMIGQSITRIIPPERLHEEYEILARIQRGEMIDHFQTQRRTKDGRLLDISLTISPIKDAAGNIVGASKIARDITSEKRAEAELKERETMFRSLAETLPQMIWVRNVDGKIEYASKDWKEYSGFDNISEAWRAMVHPEDWDYIMMHWEKSTAEQRSFRYEVRLRNKQGEYRWHSAVGEPVRNESGEVIKWLGALTDIHEQKTFAENLEKQVAIRTLELSMRNAELAQSHEHFSLLFNVSPVAKILTRADDGTIINVNPAWEQLFGKKRDAVIGSKSVIEGMITREGRILFEKEIAANGGSLIGKEMDFRLPNGNIVNTLVSVVTMELNGVSHYLTAFADITARKQAEEKIAQANTELEEKNKELESFTYISSHDLQEPLRKILTFISRIEKDNLSVKNKDLIEKVAIAAKRMKTLIQDLLTFSRINKEEPHFERTHLSEVLQQVKDEFKDVMVEKGAVIETGEMCDINVIRFQMLQLLHNLVSNSLKFTKPGVPARIRIESKMERSFPPESNRTGPACHLIFSDNGIGFEPEFNEKVFEVFQKLHNKEEYPGTGIGLSIVKKIVENHKGFISVHSKPGSGTSFDIYFPA